MPDLKCPNCGASASLPLGMTCDNHQPQPVPEATDWSVRCDCGYTVPGLTEMQARRFAAQHDEADGNFACWPEIERAES